MKTNVTKKISMMMLGLIAAALLFLAVPAKGVKAADNIFDVSSTRAHTFTFTDDTDVILLKAGKTGYASFTLKMTGISKGNAKTAALYSIYSDSKLDEKHLMLVGTYPTPGKDLEIGTYFTSSSQVNALVLSKPDADEGNSKTVTVTLTPTAFDNVVTQTHSLGTSEKFDFAQKKGILYWPLKLTKDTKVTMKVDHPIVDSKKKAVSYSSSTSDGVVYNLTKGTYYIKTENGANTIAKQSIEYTTTAIKNDLWSNNSKRKSAKTISLKKKVTGTIPDSSKNKDQNRFFKFKLSKTTKITITNYIASDKKASLKIADSKGKYIQIKGLYTFTGASLQRKGKLSYEVSDLNLNTKSYKTFSLPAGTYYIELTGYSGEYSFRLK